VFHAIMPKSPIAQTSRWRRLIVSRSVMPDPS
jgi:hypothetical protein